MNLQKPIVALFVLILSGCNISVPNVEVCGKIPGDGAACAWTIDGRERDLTEDEVIEWEHSQGYFMIGVESWGAVKAFILKACEKLPKSCREMDTVIEREYNVRRVTPGNRLWYLQKKFENIEEKLKPPLK